MKKKVAPLEEVLATLTSIMRGDEQTNVRESLKAAEDLLKYYGDAKPPEADGKQTGVVLLPEVSENK
ncbi:MAG: hypothetical protein J1G06_09845 [Oscillospiraceae bacterium]|nr:hypothetical protein [Oscillospiraceae bacterium]